MNEPTVETISAEVLLDLADGRKLAFKKDGEGLQVCLEDVCTTLPKDSTTVQELLKLLQEPPVSVETNGVGPSKTSMPDLTLLSPVSMEQTPP